MSDFDKYCKETFGVALLKKLQEYNKDELTKHVNEVLNSRTDENMPNVTLESFCQSILVRIGRHVFNVGKLSEKDLVDMRYLVRQKLQRLATSTSLSEFDGIIVDGTRNLNREHVKYKEVLEKVRQGYIGEPKDVMLYSDLEGRNGMSDMEWMAGVSKQCSKTFTCSDIATDVTSLLSEYSDMTNCRTNYRCNVKTLEAVTERVKVLKAKYIVLVEKINAYKEKKAQNSRPTTRRKKNSHSNGLLDSMCALS
jgi:hypothetical protein